MTTQAQAAPSRKHKSVSYSRYGYYFIAPFFIVFLIFQLYPIIFTFRTSITDAAGYAKLLNSKVLAEPFELYRKIFSDPLVAPKFWGALCNTLIIWIFNFIPQIGLALILASWFTDSRLRLKGQGFYKVTIFMPNIITAATIGMLFMSLFSFPVAPINTFLQTSGIVNMPVEYFRSTAWSRGLISFIQWWMWCGNTMIVMIAGISGINPSLFEAALVDGCSSRQTFWKITLPLIKPILIYNLTTSLVGGLTMFDIPHMMTQGNPVDEFGNGTTNTVARFIYTQGFTGSHNFNMASAASIVLFGIIIIGSLVIRYVLNEHEPKPGKLARKGAVK